MTRQSVDPVRVDRTCSLMKTLLSASDVSAYVQHAVGLTGHDLVSIGQIVLEAFRKRSMYSEAQLLSLNDPAEMRIVLNLLAANRATRTAFHNSKLRIDDPSEKPYELNSLLRNPIVRFESEYFAPYPELIGYGNARGIFFRFCEEGREAFRAPFVRAFESITAAILRSALPGAVILTEEEERQLGWHGKTNDVTVIVGDTALMIECKLSGLFVDAKRTAAPDAISADVRKQIADGKTRRSLFRLHDNREAITSGAIPAPLAEKYKHVKRFFPVMLLFGAIEHANAGVTIGNIVKDELLAYGVSTFDYQIWHLEELSWLAEYAGQALMEWVSEKFTDKYRSMGLNSFVGDRRGKQIFRPIMYMPHGDTKAYRILKRLSQAGL
jgi:hypothetical protein